MKTWKGQEEMLKKHTSQGKVRELFWGGFRYVLLNYFLQGPPWKEKLFRALPTGYKIRPLSIKIVYLSLYPGSYAPPLVLHRAPLMVAPLYLRNATFDSQHPYSKIGVATIGMALDVLCPRKPPRLTLPFRSGNSAFYFLRQP